MIRRSRFQVSGFVPATARSGRGRAGCWIGLLALAIVMVDSGRAASAQAPTGSSTNSTAPRTRVVLLIGEDEYHTWETLPEFARTELEPRGFDVRIVQQDAADKHRFSDLKKALPGADLLLVSVRRRALPKEDLDLVRDHIAQGRPVVGIRTASHAFAPAAEAADRGDRWPDFDEKVLGGNYHGHHGSGPVTVLKPVPSAATDPILVGVSFENFTSVASLYLNSPLRPNARPLVMGTIPGKPEEPVAWTHFAGSNRARVFYTSLGHTEDFKSAAFRRLLLNGMYWAMGRPTSDVTTVPGPAAAQPRAEVYEKLVPPKPALTPAESARRFNVVEGLEVELVLSEPEIAQPLQLSFDERGRLWVVEYRQYPAPAGLTMVSHDQYWRAVYDKVPPPPPRHFKGADRVSIHEDTDGNGTYDRHTVFVDGLNIATSVARGRGGVWVLNPPYLLFYPDRDGDDHPDADPEVHLEGFGLEDTHSVANSLRWGPDGWLYAAQGSTVSGRIHRPGSTNEPIHTLGQNIWRYHPETRRYEVFAEGGGNAFGVEIDDQGRIFSGHNGGNTRGFHYVQGGYLQKGFEKHGQLSNPYAFGYFPPMPHHDVERFTHTFLIYGGGALSGAFDGRLFGIEPMQGRVVMSEMEREGTTFRTKDVGYALRSADPWFKPVDIKHGPDGAIYIADWYDFQVNHWRNYQGNMDAGNGRVYRLKAAGAKPGRPTDLGQFSTDALIDALDHGNRWVRQTALRLLADRQDPGAPAKLRQRFARAEGQGALETLWALHVTGGMNAEVAERALAHAQPHVREWAVRLLGDAGRVTDAQAAALSEMAARDPDAEVRLQLAATARRLPAVQGLPVVRRLMERDEDAADARQPLMVWWALEARAERDRDAVIGLLDDPGIWNRSMMTNHLLERLMRRFAAAGSAEDFKACTELLRRAPSAIAREKLVAGFEAAFRERSLAGLPASLLEAVAKAGGGSLALQLRTGRPGAETEALELMVDEKAEPSRRTQVIQTVGELKLAKALPALFTAMNSEKEPVRIAALAALQPFDDPAIGEKVVSALPAMSATVRVAALNLLATRGAWALRLARAAESKQVDPAWVGKDIVRQIKQHKVAELADVVVRVWPHSGRPSTADMEGQIQRIAATARAGTGDPFAGRKLFTASCGVCHKLFNVGGSIGPDLTPFRRDDLEALLLSIVNPSAEIREGYENFQVETRDERSLTGFVVRQDDRAVVLRGLDGQDVVLQRGEIAELRPAGLSLMPEGLLENMGDQELRDLFAYLRSSQPLVN
ncbi:MAG: ThuA domain-containing protein [Verrucomicrobiales bacterium]|nr:ThuA domain-containing protein [Verrucomicrobiales bacterium]